MEKLTPLVRQVAPKGEGEPGAVPELVCNLGVKITCLVEVLMFRESNHEFPIGHLKPDI